MAVPKLRFKEFDGDWEKTTLGEVVKFSNGKRVPLSETDRQKRQGIYRYYGASGVIDYVDDYLFDGQYILIGEDGANIITRSSTLAFVVEGQFWVNNHAHIFQSKHGDNVFLATYLESLNYERFNSGTAQPKLNLENLKKVPVANPQKTEQTKIASFLSAVDEKISQLTQKHELLSQYKQGMMQKLFSQQIRFKADDGRSEFGEWESISIKNAASFIKDGTHGTHQDDPTSHLFLLSAKNLQNGHVVIDEKDRRINKLEFDSIYKNYGLNTGDILLSVVGTIGRVAIFKEEYKNYAFQRSVAFMRFKSAKPEFIFQLFNAVDFQNELLVRQVVSAQPGIYLGDLSKIEIKLPCLEEQVKIANFLSAIDQKIEVVAQQIEQAKQWKKGLLQQMFV